MGNICVLDLQNVYLCDKFYVGPRHALIYSKYKIAE